MTTIDPVSILVRSRRAIEVIDGHLHEGFSMINGVVKGMAVFSRQSIEWAVLEDPPK
jgi:hypothetical protein